MAGQGKRPAQSCSFERTSVTRRFGPNVLVTTAKSNEHDCAGLFPCPAIDYGTQQGDYAGLVAFDGTAYPIWTDSRNNTQPATGCRRGLTMEEVFMAAVR